MTLLEDYNGLFDSYYLNNKLKLKNRFVMAPMTTWSGEHNGAISEAELAYYKYRSTGVGMVITGTTYLEPTGKGFSGQFYGGDDSMLGSLKSLADEIHAGGAKAILQIFHAGRKANPKDMPDAVTLSASNIPGKRESDNVPKSMTINEIDRTIESFKKATIRAHKAGFDGIEIHGANTYLIQQFFSPHSNRRTDKFGGSLEKRMTFPELIVKSCLEAKADIDNADFIIGYRFSPEENSDPGISLNDTDYLIDELCKTDLDYLHISLSDYKQTSIREKTDDLILKRVVDVINNRKALIGVGSIYSLEDASQMMSLGVELAAVGRQLLIDGLSVDKWTNEEDAKTIYNPNHYLEEKIPEQLHNVIMSVEGWIPK